MEGNSFVNWTLIKEALKKSLYFHTLTSTFLQLAVSEGTKSKLLEQVSWLEKKLEALDCREDSGEPYKKMVLAKDQVCHRRRIIFILKVT